MKARHRAVSTPIFEVREIEDSADFYKSLGFRVIAYDSMYSFVIDGDNEILHLQMSPMIGSSTAYLRVRDVDQLHHRWRESGVEVGSIENQPWDMREFTVEDPDGNTLRVGQNL